MSVIKSVTKGKNDRIELAATENAKVCTSVRNRYFAVETASPGERLRRLPDCGEGPGSAAWGTGVVVGSGTGSLNPIKGLRFLAFFEDLVHERNLIIPYTLLKLKCGPWLLFT